MLPCPHAAAAVERLDTAVAALDAYAEERDDDADLPPSWRPAGMPSQGRSPMTSTSRRPWRRCSSSSATSTAGSRNGASRAPTRVAEPPRSASSTASWACSVTARRDLTPDLAAMLEARAEARRTRDWARSDELRDSLAAAGIAVEDTRDGQRWRRAGA